MFPTIKIIIKVGTTTELSKRASIPTSSIEELSVHGGTDTKW